MVTLHPYLSFAGKAEEALTFYKSVFGGEFRMVSRYRESPNTEHLSPSDMDQIMHIALPIGRHGVLMAMDIPASMRDGMAPGQNISLSLNTDSKEETADLYRKLSAGGTIEMPLADMFWGAYFGMFTDRYGVRWMVNYEYPHEGK